MNSLRTATLRFANLVNTSTGALGKREFTRSLWHMTKKPAAVGDHVTVLNVHKPSINCTCGCNVHTKGEYLIDSKDVSWVEDCCTLQHNYITSMRVADEINGKPLIVLL